MSYLLLIPDNDDKTELTCCIQCHWWLLYSLSIWQNKAPNINKARKVMGALNAVPIIGTWILSASYLIYSLRQNTCWH